MAKVTDPKLLAELIARFAADPLVIKWTPKRQRDAALGRALMLSELTQLPPVPAEGPRPSAPSPQESGSGSETESPPTE